jgi:hypothetical protein
VWHLLTHSPSSIIAAAPLSGYLSIPLYVPFTFWKPTSPAKRAVVEAATLHYRHEMFASNFKGIPVLQQHGSGDDNVPAYHSRFMHEMAAGGTNYSEVQGRGHWWEGVVTTEALKRFYVENLERPKQATLEEVGEFEMVVTKGGMAGRFGVEVLYMEEVGRLGKMKVRYTKEMTEVEVDNVLAFKVDAGSEIGDVRILDVGGEVEKFVKHSEGDRIFHNAEGLWTQVSTRPSYSN